MSGAVLLDAGPLQTLFLLHYLEQTRQLDTERGRALIRESRPKITELGDPSCDVLGKMLSRYRQRFYTQSGAAEALQFRKRSALKVESQNIRRFGVDAIVSQNLVEIHPARDYLTHSAKLISLVGLADAIHIHLLDRDPNLVLLTDDARLRQHAGDCIDRVLILEEIHAFGTA